jgi:tricorn protease
MPKSLQSVIFFLVLATTSRAAAPNDEARLLRFPAIHGDQVVFTYAGDLYTAPTEGGVARRLTGHDGFEMFARFSPDGKWLAFTGQYDGNTEVYLMPAEGGVPKRLTYTATLGRDDVSDRMGPNNLVMGWTPDGKQIVFRSRMTEANAFLGQLYTVSIDGGLPRQLPLPRGGFCSYSPDGNKLAYNRVFREFRTWKRYRGGMADDIWIYEFETKQLENITNNPAQDIIPMWSGNRVYFLSDRDDSRRMNLFVYEIGTKETRQLTHFSDFDIKFPSLGDKAIVFEKGGYLFRFDLADESVKKVPVRILEDGLGGRSELTNVSKRITNYEIAPDGKRALFGARGDVFTVPAKHGQTRNLTKTPGIHERNSLWSPDGKWIAYVSDETGEDEIWMVPQDGSGPAKQITSGGDNYKYELKWSPDSKKILWSDRKQRLQYVDVDSKQVHPVAELKSFETHEYAWSPDNKWIAYSEPQLDAVQRVYLFSIEQKKSYPVTDNWHDAAEPAFSADGKYLYFVSNRDFNPAYGDTEFNHIYQDMARIYFVTLAKETESPFKPKDDEVGSEAAKPADAKKKADDHKVDIDGIMDRIIDLPIAGGTYRNLQATDGGIYYLRVTSKDPRPTLCFFDLSSQKESSLGGVNGFEISADHKKMLVGKDNNYGIIDLPHGPVTIGEPLDLSGMEVELDHHAEWKEIYDECWRQMRDFFYAPNMHGVDWKAMHDKYAPLVKHVNHRADLTYILGELIGELNCGHTYVGGGEYPKPRRIETGLLGAKLKQEPRTKYYQITEILRGENWDKNLHSPLTEVGVDAKNGDYIVAVNGKPTNEMTNIYESLVNTVGKQVTLRINSQPKQEGAHDVVVVPIADESKLYYFNWVQDNIKKVDKATGGKVGYLHIPDMQVEGLNEFVKYFYPQLRKKALIIDVRGNGGGNVSPMIIERLRRELVMVDIARNGVPSTDPGGMIYGPKVCLCNEFSASDGDLFPYRFKTLKMGKLIGKRTWGGVVGIRGTLPLLDGGTLNKPEFSRFDIEGKNWIIEGHGVDPDIVVDNNPAKEFAGEDQQLNKGIEVIMEELKTGEKSLPAIPPFPDKHK